MMGAAQPVGDLLREWRQRRRMSQLDLALEAEVSTRHLSFVELGRAQPSREMMLNLLSELALECFYPADAATAQALRGLAER